MNAAGDLQASKYMDGAIIANKRSKNEAEVGSRGREDEEDDCKVMIRNDISLAISYNNKAVVELKRGSREYSREFATKSVEIMEPRVFGMINSGLVSRSNQEGRQASATQQIFQRSLQVLLIGYYNLAMSRDKEIQSRNIYLQGM